ncbi:MAG: ribonuclease HII [Firmicutes bacterium]|nr:ribonuclease HII [Bacillota bacterium]
MKDFSKMTVAEISRYLSEDSPERGELDLLAADSRVGVQRLLKKHLQKSNAERLEEKRLAALLKYENKARQLGYTYIAGVDEAGRGPLAGPVMAAAVILPENFLLPGLKDSKKLTPKKREELYTQITEAAIAWSVAKSDVLEIDRYNIFQATKLAMKRAISALPVVPDIVLIDAITIEGLKIPQQSIISGDSLSASIAAASILAKVTRDRYMIELDKSNPDYGFAQHKGYPTKAHRQAIARMGLTCHHRRSFLREVEQK